MALNSKDGVPHPSPSGEGAIENAPLLTSSSPEPSSRLAWSAYFTELLTSRRAGVATLPPGSTQDEARRFWVAAERVQTFNALYPDAVWTKAPAHLAGETLTRSDAVFSVVNGWMPHIGPTTGIELARCLALPVNEVDQALLRMEAAGSILRGRFTNAADAAVHNPEATATEWCDRRLLARIHRLTLGRLRKEIEPVTPAQFMNWLFRWQHLAAGTQLHGEPGTLHILEQLQGLELPANAWEHQVLARRISNYDSNTLNQLCLMGTIGWGRLSPHPATAEEDGATNGRRRVIPTSVAPITFFVREKSAWMSAMAASPAADADVPTGLSPTARQVFDYLRTHGASFFADIVRGVFKLKAEVETALWELVTAGLVTADAFDNLRSLIDPRRRSGQGHKRHARPRHAAGRWSLLHALPLTESTGGPTAAELHAQATEATCRMLLERYGVVFRELLTRENIRLRWRELLMAFRRLEDRGEIRGGRFVAGFLGEQFALPVAVESLRAARRQPPTGEVITISAADPLNLVGSIVPGERVASSAGKFLSFRDGMPLESVERMQVPIRTAAS